MNRFQKMSLVIGVVGLAVLGAGCCGSSRCRPRTQAVSYAMMSSAASTASTGLIRLVPIQPPLGQPAYPAGTLVDPVAGKITFAPGSGPSNVWLAIELTGWGVRGLAGYNAVAVVSDPICPREPCNCMVGPSYQTCATTANCAEGSVCVSGACAMAYVNELDQDFVFLGRDHVPSVSSSDPRYSFKVQLKRREAPKIDVGRAFVGGTLMLSASDACIEMAYVQVGFDSSSPPVFVLGNGDRVYPAYKGVDIFNEP